MMMVIRGRTNIIRNHFWSYHGGMLLMMNCCLTGTGVEHRFFMINDQIRFLWLRALAAAEEESRILGVGR